MPGCWEGPGGACEPESDKTLLDSLVRETLEESGLHVSRVVDLVAVDCWEHHRRSGDMIRIIKYSFIVDVHENTKELQGSRQPVSLSQIPVHLDATEHQAFDWATEDDVSISMNSSTGPYKFPSLPRSHQAPNILRAFEKARDI
jgi:8-oxo-dGTP pyrophosphatase MutT (NUDIX family)